ncbi:MAG: helix-turn-helix transcriptional regulator [Lachnospiraceae bacterium]|nr:helix-turn-helix transcriptional regulator [Lachnospiraceae bacterium]
MAEKTNMTNKTIFKIEWKRFLKEHNYKSTEEALEKEEALAPLKSQSSTISRFCSGSRPISSANLVLFANLFGVTEEYLAGASPYRTEQDLHLAIKKTENITHAIHTLLLNLGYADLYTEATDYNQTFPSNTQVFIENMKKDLADTDLNLLIDVQKDRFVPLSPEAQEYLINELTDFIQYRMSRLLTGPSSMDVPTCILEDGSTLLHPHEEIPLNDGNVLYFDSKYIPSAKLLNGETNGDTTLELTIKKRHKHDRK